MRSSRLLALLALLVLLSSPAHALDPRQDLKQLIHKRWMLEDGAPQDIRALAQSADGYIWIGSADGLFRFDGATFERIPALPEAHKRSEEVYSLLALPNGDVWVGYFWGGVSLYHDGHIRDINYKNPIGTVMQIAQGIDGSIWVNTDGRRGALQHYVKGQWENSKDNWGLGTRHLYGLAIAHNGTVWVCSNNSRSYLRPGAQSFVTTSESLGSSGSIAEDRGDSLWIIDGNGIYKLPTRADPADPAKPLPLNPNPLVTLGRQIVFDQQGALWAASRGTGLIRIRQPESRPLWPLVADGKMAAMEGAELLGSQGGLTGPTVQTILEDREGNMWLGTRLGLDLLSQPDVVLESLPGEGANIENAELFSLNGDVFIQTDKLAYRVTLSGRPELFRVDSEPVEKVCKSSDEAFWARTSTKMVHVSHDSVIGTAALPPLGTGESKYEQFMCAGDVFGNLWLVDEVDGLLHYTDHAWMPHTAFPDAPHIWPFVLSLTANGQLLAYYALRELDVLSSSGMKTLLRDEDSSLGLIRGFNLDGEDLLISGDFGLMRMHEGRLQTLLSAQYPVLRGLAGVAAIPGKEYWLYGRNGIIRVEATSLSASFEHPGLPLDMEVFNYHQGLSGTLVEGANDSVAIGGDGRIWFATVKGPEWLDSRNITHNHLPPPIVIRSISAEGHIFTPGGRIVIPAGTERLQIAYTALSYANSDRIKFRYKLDGFDRDWVDSGGRREAFYTNLSPGTYTFHVIAANGDGIWNTVGAAVTFELPPSFVQSNAFICACALATGFLAWSLYVMRTRQLAERLRQRLEAQLTERERIARELHDTLLQGVQGLLLRFQAVLNRMPMDQPIRDMMEKALERADEVLIEGRDRVRDLRAPPPADFTRTISAFGEDLAAGENTKFSYTIEGVPRPLGPEVQEEIMRIAHEAMRNAFVHANATTINLSVVYGRQAFCLGIVDNGAGIPSQWACKSGRPGHFGLTGMQERAERIGGSLLISTSRPGTSITVSVPAASAYQLHRLGWSQPWKMLRITLKGKAA